MTAPTLQPLGITEGTAIDHGILRMKATVACAWCYLCEWFGPYRDEHEQVQADAVLHRGTQRHQRALERERETITKNVTDG